MQILDDQTLASIYSKKHLYTGHIDGKVPIYVMVYVLHPRNNVYLLLKSGGKKGEKRSFLAKVSQHAPPMGVGGLI